MSRVIPGFSYPCKRISSNDALSSSAHTIALDVLPTDVYRKIGCIKTDKG